MYLCHGSSFLALLGLLASPVVAQDNAPSPECAKACEILAQSFGSRLHYPANDNATFWDSKQAEVVPACRVEPTGTEEVASVLKTLVQTSCKFAIRSGGHTRERNDANSDGGVTIDLRQIRDVEPSADRSRIRLGTGHVLVSSYRAAESEGLMFLGGRVDSVGVAGFTLGGGLSNFSPRYGLAMDNVFEYEMVLANSSIVTVSETENPDLYWALRGGGGNNFGIVTYFTVRAFEQGLSWGGAKTYSDDQTEALLDELHHLTTEGSSADLDMAFWSTYTYSAETGEFGWIVNQGHSLPAENPAVFERLNAVPHESSSLRLDSFSNFSIEAAGATPWPRRNIFASISHYPSAELERRILEVFRAAARGVEGVEGFSATTVNQPFFQGSVAAMKARGGNPVAVEADRPFTVSLLILTWLNAEDDDAVYAAAEGWIEKATAAAEDAGLYHPYLYINYAMRTQDPLGRFPTENLERLRRIQSSVDPAGIFTSNGLCTGYFKVQ
ncbi:FAD binding domain protein [Boeremia exigua]|uniref:FAD binding domain protein n=1 Tax=Boeremia exigua TaxID=749465 RepID=UPI001E8CE2C2|nr:FAD binding domain protein [Boeremia exigua]KAH6612421.1 FAD binding domain protein [Boeremia exigua]